LNRVYVAVFLLSRLNKESFLEQ